MTLSISRRRSLRLLSQGWVPNLDLQRSPPHSRGLEYTQAMSISASQWGSPNASRRALLIHGLTMSSNSWESVAQLLVAEGQVLDRTMIASFLTEVG
jgi:hypothetical protein